MLKKNHSFSMRMEHKKYMLLKKTFGSVQKALDHLCENLDFKFQVISIDREKFIILELDKKNQHLFKEYKLITNMANGKAFMAVTDSYFLKQFLK